MTRYDPNRLNFTPFFTEKERTRLHALAAEFPLSELTGSTRVLEDKSVDYAYVSSRIEGSTYSRKGVSALLNYDRTEGGKLLSDALMVLDINAAFLYVVNNARDLDVCSKTFIKDLHARTTSRQLRPEEQCVVRNKAVRIAGSDYEPPESPSQLDAEFTYLTEVLKSIDDPFEKAVYAHCSLAYLKYFADGNKRTSRLLQTAILIHHGINPIFLRAEEIENYLHAVVAYYETGDQRPYAELFFRNYEYTINGLLGRLPEQQRQIAEDEERLQAALAERRLRQNSSHKSA